MSKKPKWLSKIEKMANTMVASDLSAGPKLEFPSPSFNWALGGGVEFGKILTVYGPESGGKSLLCYLAAAELHKNDPEAWVVWFDAEMSFTKEYAQKLGVDTDRVLHVADNTASGIFDRFIDEILPLIQDEGDPMPVRMIVIDSCKSIIGPKEDNTESVTKVVMGDLPVLLGRGLKAWMKHIREHQILTMIVQQVNEEMDLIEQKRGKKYRLPGGRALRHFSDYMVLVERIERKADTFFDDNMKGIEDKGVQTGHTVRCKIEKNRTAIPYLVANFRLRYGQGLIDRGWEIGTLAINLGVVERPNNKTFAFEDVKVTGKDNFIAKVEEDPEFADRLMKAVMEVDAFSLENATGIKEVEKEEEEPEELEEIA